MCDLVPSDYTDPCKYTSQGLIKQTNQPKFYCSIDDLTSIVFSFTIPCLKLYNTSTINLLENILLRGLVENTNVPLFILRLILMMMCIK